MVNPKDLQDYAVMLGGRCNIRTFEAGQTIFISTPSGGTFSDQWLDKREYDEAMRRAVRWLNNQPWPTENDPRVEGEY